MKINLKVLHFLFAIFVFYSCGSSSKNTWKSPNLTLFKPALDDTAYCYRIPSLIRTNDGSLVACADQRMQTCGDLRSNEDINIVMRRSEDNGETWSTIKRIIDYPQGESASDPSMLLDRVTGNLFLFYNYMNLKSENGIYYFYCVTSKDHGKSWSKPVDITSYISKPDWKGDFKFITSGKGIQTDDGVLLHTVVNLDKGLHVFASVDHGENWFLIDTAIYPGDESKIIELSDGRWMINSRVNGTGLRYIHLSEDEGRSWFSRAEPNLDDPGCNASIANNQKGDKLLFSHINHKQEREGLCLRVSEDEGKSWGHCKMIYSGSAAYSSIDLIGRNELGVLFEMNNYAEIAFTRIDLNTLLY